LLGIYPLNYLRYSPWLHDGGGDFEGVSLIKKIKTKNGINLFGLFHSILFHLLLK
jgi:hypothetical protein